ncbi:MAG: UDP-3-O-[3-hydroxymyristoyl] N-acetylglucosamine deacetylase [Elusimicrobiaceae bacterium]|jgi:UDP-3-O-[3-hydroxymyristoyl] N-acetylglucosamine deacetylase|nr:UDP-3-O-[3-hydroxymyristoyl] N-acetylglucosamine deacetylase [Elusimicrobiaceae bacterium]MBT6715773.1 UDP-3-O-[3-hydroxymyristoyl] N-acetylglucosamine deacetylase [Elusimicrobiaceae bacterium]MBT7283556.1 UDP-3-O-[3-hydroxymyristoyl] N-acetylglucosamine deacetylase [Elusimicrobiaceae bacterium]
MNYKKTLNKEIIITGVGIHTGLNCEAKFVPQETGEGIIFHYKGQKIPAKLENVSSTERGTNLAVNGAEIFTIEHILSSLYAMGITDVDIFLNAPEPPILDGSSIDFLNKFLEVGTKDLKQEKEVLTVNKKIEYLHKEIYYSIEPSNETIFEFEFIHPHPLIQKQTYSFSFNLENYKNEIATARTFGFEEELEYLKKSGLAKGASLENAVLIKKDGYSSPLRFENELVRHKIIDLIGDLSLMGKEFKNVKIKSICGGHKHNIAFAKKLQEKLGG